MFSAKLCFPAFQHFHRIKAISQAAAPKSPGDAGIQLVTSSAPLFTCLNQDPGTQLWPAPGRTIFLHSRAVPNATEARTSTGSYLHQWYDPLCHLCANEKASVKVPVTGTTELQCSSHGPRWQLEGHGR